jgi:subtilisin family serine protease
MSKRTFFLLVVGGLLALLLAGCDTFLTPKDALSPMSTTSGGGDYLVIFRGSKLPADVEEDVIAAGGHLRTRFDQVGAVLATAQASSFVADIAAISGVQYVVPDVALNWLPGERYVEEFTGEHESLPMGESIGDDEWFYNAYQWSMKAIDASGAWDAGYTGAGVRVAILDSGIDPNHPDLSPNLNAALSTSFVPYEPTIDDGDGHGTHVAGIVAAADNGYGSIGVAPNAEIVAVKVLDSTGSGAFSWIISGMLYANTIGADVINMSLGAYLPRSGFEAGDGTWVGANEVAGLVTLLTRVINYVWSNGSFVVAAAGNDSVDFTGDMGLLHVPSDCGRTVSIAATGPLGWGIDPTVSLDTPAFYTNYGSAIDYAAPGGNVDFDLYPNPGWWFDLVFSTYPGGWAWMAGTSMASPHVAGVAALIIEANGYRPTPSQVESVLRRSADDLGKPGRDEWYGHGRVNAAQAVQ